MPFSYVVNCPCCESPGCPCPLTTEEQPANITVTLTDTCGNVSVFTYQQSGTGFVGELTGIGSCTWWGDAYGVFDKYNIAWDSSSCCWYCVAKTLTPCASPPAPSESPFIGEEEILVFQNCSAIPSEGSWVWIPDETLGGPCCSGGTASLTVSGI